MDGSCCRVLLPAKCFGDIAEQDFDLLTHLVEQRVTVHNDDDMAYKKARAILADLFDGP